MPPKYCEKLHIFNVQDLFYTFVGYNNFTQFSANLRFKKTFLLGMVKSKICLGNQTSKLSFFPKNVPQKTQPYLQYLE